MRSSNKNADFFDDDFEVRYEEDLSLDNDMSSDHNFNGCKFYDIENDFEDDYEDTYDEDEDYNDGYDDYDADDYEDRYDTRNRRNRSYGSRNQRDYYEEERPSKRKKQVSYKRRRSRKPLTRIAAPIQKGGDAVMKLVRTIVRNLSLILMIAITIYMGYNFLRGSAPYGDIETSIATNTYTLKLAVYFGVVAMILLYEIISMLWAMTRVRVRDDRGTYKEDVGRGLFSFVFLFLCSYASFIVYRWVPESHEILQGLKGVLDVFGSMHNVLFGLCLAGVVSCLFRKYSISL